MRRGWMEVWTGGGDGAVQKEEAFPVSLPGQPPSPPGGSAKVQGQSGLPGRWRGG